MTDVPLGDVGADHNVDDVFAKVSMPVHMGPVIVPDGSLGRQKVVFS